jgi:hypothetical protein
VIGMHYAVRTSRLVRADKNPDSRGRVEGNVFAIAQPHAELAVVHCLPTERGFCDPRLPTKRLDFPEQGVCRALIQLSNAPGGKADLFFF